MSHQLRSGSAQLWQTLLLQYIECLLEDTLVCNVAYFVQLATTDEVAAISQVWLFIAYNIDASLIIPPPPPPPTPTPTPTLLLHIP